MNKQDTQPPSTLLQVGKVLKSHGLCGEVVVKLFTNRTERLDKGFTLYSNQGKLTVMRSFQYQGRRHYQNWIVLFSGIENRTQADKLRGTTLLAPPTEDAGVLWVHEIIGARVLDVTGSFKGVVKEVEANPASDLLVLEGGVLIPMHFCVDHGKDWIMVDPPKGIFDD
ncbi:MAG: ribosome maturation factor RimM [Actinobacteria bacterium]|nr:ribosome maturation factor RimM [Actinomycetota bacterium]MCL6104067.1 ribosome maturation factor RimM [Actinomycetota bacterium]